MGWCFPQAMMQQSPSHNILENFCRTYLPTSTSTMETKKRAIMFQTSFHKSSFMTQNTASSRLSYLSLRWTKIAKKWGWKEPTLQIQQGSVILKICQQPMTFVCWFRSAWGITFFVLFSKKKPISVNPGMKRWPLTGNLSKYLEQSNGKIPIDISLCSKIVLE